MEKAILGGGCFWCLEAVFERLQGVARVVSGYAGGAIDNPGYEAVCSGTTGHAEVVEVEFDPAVLSYSWLLEVFFAIHDPTTLNRQGADVGTQYRSVIYATTGQQRVLAEQMIGDLERAGVFSAPIVTQVAMAPKFHPAEGYHQAYFRRNPGQGYCNVVIAPKLAKVRQHFAEWLTPAD